MPQPQPESSKDRALREALGGHVAFDDKAIVNNIFRPSEVDTKTVTQILNTLNAQQELRKARDQVLQERRVIERQKYWSIMKLLEHISTYDYKPKALPNDKYAEVIQRRWKATHSRNIGIDPGIYLPSAKKHFEYDYSETSSAEDDRLHFELDGDDGSDGYSNHSDGSEDLEDIEEDEVEANSILEEVEERPQEEIKGEANGLGQKRELPADENDSEENPAKKFKKEDNIDEEVRSRRADGVGLFDCDCEAPIDEPYRRHGCVWVTAKPMSENKPNPQTDEEYLAIKPVLRQMADIARLHLATRPFMRYSLHFAICGPIFNVCLFDRAGAVVSKDFDLGTTEGLETFVRVVRRAACEMNACDLGLDPTVTPLSSLGSVADYPRFKVPVGNNDYYTHGFPIWQSMTLQGRGTWVFNACLTNDPFPSSEDNLILKNSWRAKGRLPESKMYAILQKIPKEANMRDLGCVAECIDGGDVMHPEGHSAESSAIQISSHRTPFGPEEPFPNPTLHRLVLKTRGRSLITYESFNELLNAALCVTEGLEALSQRGVTHRDVSIGNVFIGTDPSKAAGFVCDLDLSTISDATIKAAYPKEDEHQAIIAQLKRGEWRTGTALSMATALLDDLESGTDRNNVRLDFKYELRHDLESLIWVIVYAMMINRRNFLANNDDQVALAKYKSVLDDRWSSYSYASITDQHRAMCSAGQAFARVVEDTWFPDRREAVFFHEAMTMVQSNYNRLGTVPITPENLTKLLKKHLQK